MNPLAAKRRDVIASAAMLTIQSMRETDIPVALTLTRQAGWNQMEEDWRRFLDMQPDGCFVGALDGRTVATTVSCILGPVAWIAMVLVDVSARKHGVATALLRHAIAYLDGLGVKTIRLDATAAGRPLYEKLGFVGEYQVARFEGIAPQFPQRPEVTQATASDFDEIIEFDRQATGTPREMLLIRLFEASPQDVRVLRQDERLEGYVSMRTGANARQIGPCIARADAGEALISDAMSRLAGSPVLIDVPRDNAPANSLMEAAGLHLQRHFIRMYRGEQLIEHPEAIWASSGPESG